MPIEGWQVDPPELPDEASLGALDDAELAQSEYYDLMIAGAKWLPGQRNGFRFDTVVLRGSSLAKTDMPSVRFQDVRLATCDLSGALFRGGQFLRVELTSTRLTGFIGSEGRFDHVLVRGCKAEYAILAMARFARCRFEKCDLSHATFEQASLSQVTFRDCNLTRARFIGARMAGVDLRGSRLDGLEMDAFSLKGLVIDPLQTVHAAAIAGAIIEKVIPADGSPPA